MGAGAIAARYEQLKRRRVTVSPGELEGRVAAIIASRDSDRAAAQVIDETITYLGAGIADLVNLFNPERVVVGGWLGRALGDDLLPRIRARQAAGRCICRSAGSRSSRPIWVRTRSPWAARRCRSPGCSRRAR